MQIDAEKTIRTLEHTLCTADTLPGELNRDDRCLLRHRRVEAGPIDPPPPA